MIFQSFKHAASYLHIYHEAANLTFSLPIIIISCIDTNSGIVRLVSLLVRGVPRDGVRED